MKRQLILILITLISSFSWATTNPTKASHPTATKPIVVQQSKKSSKPGQSSKKGVSLTKSTKKGSVNKAGAVSKPKKSTTNVKSSVSKNLTDSSSTPIEQKEFVQIISKPNEIDTLTSYGSLRIDTVIVHDTIFKIDTLLTDIKLARILLLYPLQCRYDSTQVNYTLQLVNLLQYEKKYDKLCGIMLPILKNYQRYNDEIAKCLNSILIDIKYGISPRKVDFEDRLNRTYYRKNCNVPALRIRYLEDIIKDVDNLFDYHPKEITKEKIEEILGKLKD